MHWRFNVVVETTYQIIVILIDAMAISTCIYTLIFQLKHTFTNYWTQVTWYTPSAVSNHDDVEVWEDDSCDDDIPDLPLVGRTCTEEKDLMGLIIIFLQLQAKHYIPDTTLDYLIKFFVCVFSLVSRSSAFVSNITQTFPKSLYKLRKRYSIAQSFQKYVVCQKSCTNVSEIE